MKVYVHVHVSVDRETHTHPLLFKELVKHLKYIANYLENNVNPKTILIQMTISSDKHPDPLSIK